MITAGITAAVGGLLSLFGIAPGPYLVGVAIVVKITVVIAGIGVGARLVKRRAAAKLADKAAAEAGGQLPR